MKWPMAVSVVETGKTKTGLEKESKKTSMSLVKVMLFELSRSLRQVARD